MGWFILAVVLLIVLLIVICSAVVAGRSDEVDEQYIRANSEALGLETETVHILTPQPSPTPTVWAMYPVPLDRDVQKYIYTQSTKRGIGPALVMAIIGTESNYDASCVGDGGDSVGLMQIQPIYFLDRMEKNGTTDLRDPYQNIDLGLGYLEELYATGNGTEWVLMAYNGGAAYADRMAEAGAISDYASTVIRLSGELEDSGILEVN